MFSDVFYIVAQVNYSSGTYIVLNKRSNCELNEDEIMTTQALSKFQITFVTNNLHNTELGSIYLINRCFTKKQLYTRITFQDTGKFLSF